MEEKFDGLDSKEICKKLKVEESIVLNIYLVGSSLTGTKREESDYDFIMVLDDQAEFESEGHLEYKKQQEETNKEMKIDASCYKKTEFIELIKQNEITVLFTLFVPPQFIIKENFDFKEFFLLDKLKLRKSISTVSSKAAQYAKILFLKEKDLIKSKKNIIHSIRFLQFGFQIIEFGKISDFHCSNQYFDQIMNDTSVEWQNYKETYLKSISKKLSREFQKLIPDLVSSKNEKRNKNRKMKREMKKLEKLKNGNKNKNENKNEN